MPNQAYIESKKKRLKNGIDQIKVSLWRGTETRSEGPTLRVHDEGFAPYRVMGND